MTREIEIDDRPIMMITTDLPGMKGIKVPYTGPTIIKENSSKPSKPKAPRKKWFIF
jgi:hypothetical protein